MKKSLIIIGLLSVFILAAVQPDEELANLSGKKRLNAYAELMTSLSYENPQWVVTHSEEAIKLADEYRETDLKTEIIKLTADSYYYLNDLETAKSFYIDAAEMVKNKDGEDSASYGYRLGDVAYCQERLLQFSAAIETYEKALAIAEKHSDWQEIIAIMNNIGNVYYKQANYEKAMEYFQKTLRSEEEHGQEENLSVIYNCIAAVHKDWGYFDEAVEYYEKALAIDRKYDNKNRIAIRLNNLGFLYQDTDEFDKALGYLLEAMEIDKQLGNADRLLKRANNITSIYLSLRNFEEAKKYLDMLQKNLNENTDANLRSTYYENYGNYYFYQNDYEQAEEFHKKSLELNKKYGLNGKRLSSYMDLAVINRDKGDYKSAYEYLEKYRLLNDSLFTAKKHERIRELELKYETEKKENQINLLQKDNEIKKLQIQSQKRIRNLLFLILLLIVIMVFLLFRSYRHKERVKRALQEKKAMEQSRLAILGELVAGIIHEVNQPLQSISFSLENMQNAIAENYADKEYLTKKTGFLAEDIERMHRIIDHVRTFSHKHSMDITDNFNINVSISNALRMTEERFRKHRIKVEMELENDLPQLKGNIYSFEQVILILLSNANDAVEEKALTSGSSFQKKIYVKTQKRQSEIVVQVADNGMGIPEEIKDKIMNPFFTTKEAGKGTGLGLSIARGIINDMNGRIDIETAEKKGTIVKISFNTQVD